MPKRQSDIRKKVGLSLKGDRGGFGSNPQECSEIAFLLFAGEYNKPMFHLVSLGHKTWSGLLLFFLVVFFTLFLPLTIGAQTGAPTSTSSPITPEQIKSIEALNASILPPQPGTVSCFDYYKFGSVQVSVSAATARAVSGTTVTFSGNIENQNSYPIVNGSVYIKIYRKETRSDIFKMQGHNQVDGFFALDNVNLVAKGTKPISFTWNVPTYAISGEYQLATFFVVDKKFNLLGLTFTDDIIGNTFDFEIVGEIKGGVYFDRNNILIDGKKYNFATFVPKLDAQKPITVSATIINSSKKEETVPISWRVCKGDSLRPENCIRGPENKVTVKAGEKKQVTFTVTDTSAPVYFIEATISNKDSKSIIGPRFVREGVTGTRLNFPALTSFPLEKGVSTTLFSCFHSMSANPPIIPGGKLELSLTDGAGNKIYTKTYEGGVMGQMMGVAGDFIPKKNIGKLTLSALLYRDGKVVDQSNLEYDCQKIDPSKCPADQISGQNDKQTIPTLLLLLLLIVVIIGTSLGFYFLKRHKRNPVQI